MNSRRGGFAKTEKWQISRKGGEREGEEGSGEGGKGGHQPKGGKQQAGADM